MYVGPVLFSCGIGGSLSNCVSLQLCIENSSTYSGQAVILQCCVGSYEMQSKEGEDKRTYMLSHGRQDPEHNGEGITEMPNKFLGNSSSA